MCGFAYIFYILISPENDLKYIACLDFNVLQMPLLYPHSFKLRQHFEKCDPQHIISWTTGHMLVPEKEVMKQLFSHMFYKFEM